MLVLAAGCSGGGSSSAPPVVAQTAPKSGTVSVTFTMKWSSAPQAAQRSPRFVPATARSVSVAVNGGAPQFLNFPASTLTIDAPVGTDTFAFATFDEQNGLGNVLSRASVTKQIALGVANTVSATLGGVVASVVVTVANPTPNAGVPATVPVNVAALDADGDTITGPGDYSQPIHLAIIIPSPSESGTLALSANTIPNASTTATLPYNGGTLTSATVVATGTGIPSASATFAPKPTIYEFTILTPTHTPQWITAGADGNMWFTEFPHRVARITSAGVVTEFPVPTFMATMSGIIAASDGRLWFTESNAGPSSYIAAVTTSGVFQEFPTTHTADVPVFLVDRGDGTVWFTAANCPGTTCNIGSVNMATGVVTETSTPTANESPNGITTAPDNKIYYTALNDKIGRLSNLGAPISEISLAPGSNPGQIVRGPTETSGSRRPERVRSGSSRRPRSRSSTSFRPTAGRWGSRWARMVRCGSRSSKAGSDASRRPEWSPSSRPQVLPALWAFFRRRTARCGSVKRPPVRSESWCTDAPRRRETTAGSIRSVCRCRVAGTCGSNDFHRSNWRERDTMAAAKRGRKKAAKKKSPARKKSAVAKAAGGAKKAVGATRKAARKTGKAVAGAAKKATGVAKKAAKTAKKATRTARKVGTVLEQAGKLIGAGADVVDTITDKAAGAARKGAGAVKKKTARRRASKKSA
jgi:hypothetical protein